jgi:hypothetical protein
MKGNRHDWVSLKHAFQAISQGGLKARHRQSPR